MQVTERSFRLILFAAVVMISGCTTIDRNVHRTPSVALSELQVQSTTLGRYWAEAAPADPSLSAFRLLPNNLEAFAARVALIEAAERTLDMQYYIFRPDDTGLFLVDRMTAAADRGVRVRILIDDMCAHGIEKTLLAFDAHPNIELRLFNPWKQRSGALIRAAEILFNSRLNHRMHNKLFIADGAVAILGGRNLADEYFSLNPDYDFRDLDVAVAGPAVRRGNELFDEFWNGRDAIPIVGLKVKATDDTTLQAAREQLAAHRTRLMNSPFAEAARTTEFMQQLKARMISWELAAGRIVGDSADKPEFDKDAPQPEGSHADQALDFFFSAKSEMLICSPYFVPGKNLTQRLCEMNANGVDVRILTNSQTSSDVPFVHAGYARYRPKLLTGGVKLLELRQHGATLANENRPFGSANSSLHAKTFVIDRKRLYIGSLNLDPRSVILNTETGVLIECPKLAESVAARILMLMEPQWSYRVTLSPKGKLQWSCTDRNGQELHFTKDPYTSWFERFMSNLAGLLPIEDQL